MAVTRYADGISTAASTETLAAFAMCDLSKWQVYWNDFQDLRDLDTTDEWVVTTTEAGSGDATEVISDAANGELLITNDNADNDLDFFQSTKEVFYVTSGKKLFFKARFKVSDATDSDIVMGLQIRDTTSLDVTDGIFFQKDDGDANLDFHVEQDNTATSATAVGVLKDNTYVTVGFYYDGSDSVEYFVNDVSIDEAVITNLPDDEALCVSFGIQNGAAAAKTMTVDYIFVANER